MQLTPTSSEKRRMAKTGETLEQIRSEKKDAARIEIERIASEKAGKEAAEYAALESERKAAFERFQKKEEKIIETDYRLKSNPCNKPIKRGDEPNLKTDNLGFATQYIYINEAKDTSSFMYNGKNKPLIGVVHKPNSPAYGCIYLTSFSGRNEEGKLYGNLPLLPCVMSKDNQVYLYDGKKTHPHAGVRIISWGEFEDYDTTVSESFDTKAMGKSYKNSEYSVSHSVEMRCISVEIEVIFHDLIKGQFGTPENPVIIETIAECEAFASGLLLAGLEYHKKVLIPTKHP